MVSSSCSAVGREKSMSRVVRRAKELQQVDGKQFGDQTLDQMKLIFYENNQRYICKHWKAYLLKKWKLEDSDRSKSDVYFFDKT